MPIGVVYISHLYDGAYRIGHIELVIGSDL